MIISQGFHLLLLQGVLPLLVGGADVRTSTQTNKSYTCLTFLEVVQGNCPPEFLC